MGQRDPEGEAMLQLLSAEACQEFGQRASRREVGQGLEGM